MSLLMEGGDLISEEMLVKGIKQNSNKEPTYLKVAKQVKAITSITRYHDKAFRKKELTFKAGIIFHIASVVKYGGITRLKLDNGLYMTSNINYVRKIQ